MAHCPTARTVPSHLLLHTDQQPLGGGRPPVLRERRPQRKFPPAAETALQARDRQAKHWLSKQTRLFCCPGSCMAASAPCSHSTGLGLVLCCICALYFSNWLDYHPKSCQHPRIQGTGLTYLSAQLHTHHCWHCCPLSGGWVGPWPRPYPALASWEHWASLSANLHQDSLGGCAAGRGGNQNHIGKQEGREAVRWCLVKRFTTAKGNNAGPGPQRPNSL